MDVPVVKEQGRAEQQSKNWPGFVPVVAGQGSGRRTGPDFLAAEGRRLPDFLAAVDDLERRFSSRSALNNGNGVSKGAGKALRLQHLL